MTDNLGQIIHFLSVRNRIMIVGQKNVIIIKKNNQSAYHKFKNNKVRK